MTTKLNKTIEIWRQDNDSQDLWHNNNGLIVNTAALNEREAYLEIMRIPNATVIQTKPVQISVSSRNRSI